MSLLKQRKGFALMTVIFIVLVFSIIGITLLYMFLVESKTSVDEYFNTRAFFIADAGKNYALKKVSSFTDWTVSMGFPISMSFAEGTFTVSSTAEAANSITLTSTGILTKEGKTYRHANRVVVTRGLGGAAFGGNAIYSYGIGGGDGIVNLQNNVVINGSVFVNGDLSLRNNVLISGDANATGDISIGSGVTVNGDTTDHVAIPSTSPSLTTTYYAGQILTASSTAAASVTYSGTNTITGTRYINGNLTISNNAQLIVIDSATLVVTGTVTSNNNIVIGNNFTLIAGGAVTINNNIDIGNSGIWYSAASIAVGNNAEIGTVSAGAGTTFLSPGDIELNNNCNISGLVFSGGSVSLGNNAIVTGVIVANLLDIVGSNSIVNYNEDVVDISDIPGISGETTSGPLQTTWQEVF
ncbi:MAG: PilX N-terminal domain-containing pilus assembly protein [Candidatus Margulisiibacteriota bacterium]